ncbi:MAG TPA: hypothetical protein VJM31_04025 [Vicinamibacterales bacterium]|nr:hypothetical protein [Vicinamibacterales bacterium]
MQNSLRGFAVVLWMIVAATWSNAQIPDTATSNVVLITLDGARIEEIFGGMQIEILRSTLRAEQKVEDSPVYRRFWAESPQARREKLMPFFWKTLMAEHGSIAGNPQHGSAVRLGNNHRFSYPGYAEILLGEPHDAEIKSNDPNRNPFPTVLEALHDHLRVSTDRVATVGSWAHFNAIVERTEGATFVNAGQEAFASGADRQLLNALQVETSIPWSDMRHDAFTFRGAMSHMATSRPRVLYLALGETDDWAHDGRYDRVLEAYAQSDRYLAQLWSWLQSQPDYKGRTHLLITTDHGRGRTPSDWRDHGAKIEGAQDVWMAFASPSMAQRGEWKAHAPLSTSQVAATIASWVGLDWNQMRPRAGAPIR